VTLRARITQSRRSTKPSTSSLPPRRRVSRRRRTRATQTSCLSLLRDHLNGYAYQALNRADQRRWEQASAGEAEGAYCAIFGPERIPGEIGSFLGYFMVRKVIAGAELLKAAGTVTKKLARWLHEHGYIDAESAADVTEQAADAGRELPAAARLSDLLTDVSMRTSPAGIDEDSVIEDTLAITRIEPGKLWFGGHGPSGSADTVRSWYPRRRATSRNSAGRSTSRSSITAAAGGYSRTALSTPDPHRSAPLRSRGSTRSPPGNSPRSPHQAPATRRGPGARPPLERPQAQPEAAASAGGAAATRQTWPGDRNFPARVHRCRRRRR